ncbi:MAG: hypothetical protein EZS28_014049 [Streblomastix strix]|uniref:Uncharacterized protein n=1 Tax=Streblomastix strix TaxID=222440 RepID=A0A5J4W674_9EUKA|nr:MAG: hypothetical protein EZS28_014049 [Streblomastix strix]
MTVMVLEVGIQGRALYALARLGIMEVKHMTDEKMEQKLDWMEISGLDLQTGGDLDCDYETEAERDQELFELADDTTDVYDLRVPYFSFVSILAIAANAFGFNV